MFSKVKICVFVVLCLGIVGLSAGLIGCGSRVVDESSTSTTITLLPGATTTTTSTTVTLAPGVTTTTSTTTSTTTTSTTTTTVTLAPGMTTTTTTVTLPPGVTSTTLATTSTTTTTTTSTTTTTTTSTTTTTAPSLDLLVQIDGEDAGDNFGWSVASAGDVDGDETPDLIIGAPNTNPDGNSYAGSAYVYSGATHDLLFQVDGAAAFDGLGSSVASAGDLTGDGRSEVIVGGDGASVEVCSYAGAVPTVLFTIPIPVGAGAFGHSVASAGDINGDHIPDLIIGAYNASPDGRAGAGSVYVYSGATPHELLFQLDGVAEHDSFGYSVASAGDVDGVGTPEVIVGAYYADPGGLASAGSAYVYSGATHALLFQVNGEAADYDLGCSVAGVGDLNHDGYDEVIIGAERADPGGLANAGSAYVYSGATHELLFEIEGFYRNDYLGYSVSGAGDVDGDGTLDIIVGANTADVNGLDNSGAVYIYSGATHELLFQINGAADSDWLGASVSSAGDINGDGKAEVIISATGADPDDKSNAGSAYIYLGR